MIPVKTSGGRGKKSIFSNVKWINRAPDVWPGTARLLPGPHPPLQRCPARSCGPGEGPRVDALQPGHLRAHVHGEALSPKGPKALAEKQGGDQLVVSPSPEAAIWGQGWDCERVPRAGTHPSAGNSSREARGPGMGSHLDLSLGMGIPPTPHPLKQKSNSRRRGRFWSVVPPESGAGQARGPGPAYRHI